MLASHMEGMRVVVVVGVITVVVGVITVVVDVPGMVVVDVPGMVVVELPGILVVELPGILVVDVPGMVVVELPGILVLLVELVDVESPQPPPTVSLLTRKSPLQLPLAKLPAWAAASENEDPSRRRP